MMKLTGSLAIVFCGIAVTGCETSEGGMSGGMNTNATTMQVEEACADAAEDYFNLQPGDVEIEGLRDIGDTYEVDAVAGFQSATCTVDKSSGRVMNVG